MLFSLGLVLWVLAFCCEFWVWYNIGFVVFGWFFLVPGIWWFLGFGGFPLILGFDGFLWFLFVGVNGVLFCGLLQCDFVILGFWV